MGNNSFGQQLLQQTASSATQGVLGGVMGLVMGGINDKRQIRQQEKLQELQMKGQRAMIDYQKLRDLQFWQDTSYPAQKELMEKAGLNPALMYGMGGGGGQTTGGSAGAPTGGQAPSGGGEMQAGMGIMLQNAMLKAQIENIQADTKVKEGEAANKGLQGENIQTQTASLLQGIENQKAQGILINAQANIANMDAALKFKTFDAAANYIELQTEEAIQKVKQAAAEAKLLEGTVDEKIKIVKQEAILATLNNTLARANIRLTNAQTGQVEQQTKLTTEQTKLAADYIHNQILQRNVMNWNDANTKEMLRQMGIKTDYETDIPAQIIKGLTGTISTIIGISGLTPPTPKGTKPPEVAGFHGHRQ